MAKQNKDYYISSDQFETISHHMRMFDMEADRILELCSSEKVDIKYGFELGQMYTHLRACYQRMLKLEGEISAQITKT